MLVTVTSTNNSDSVDVELVGVDSAKYQLVSDFLIQELERERIAYVAVGKAMLMAVDLLPQANPADLWVHLIYNQYRTRANRSDQSWKRVSGDAFEFVVRTAYEPRLHAYKIVLRRPIPQDAVTLGLRELAIGGSKTDLILERIDVDESSVLGVAHTIFGVVHCKASLAERLSDDAPASKALIDRGYWSVEATMDAKMFPPPHGDAVVRGELQRPRSQNRGGDKRRYFEIAGQFNGCYSFNLRTPPSDNDPAHKARIRSLSLSEQQPDVFVQDVIAASKIYGSH